MHSLPIAALLPELIERMRQSPRLILTAPPGSGKTTAVPLALLESDWLGRRKLLVVEPRRLATRAAANRMADLRGEAVGESVGYRMRLESRCGPRTRIEVVTEGLFTRMIQSDPELAGVGAVLFDEFHERSLDADLGLALTLDVQSSLRPDLRILLMSATLEDARLREALGAPVVSADVRGHPVGIEYLGGDARQPLAGRVVAALRRVWAQHPGHVLVFLPGLGEIRQVQRQLDGAALPGASVMPLHGSLPRSEQLRALEPDTSVRKIVLASAVAETSLTIDGVGVVIDAGLSRQPRFDLARGLTRLETVRASRASAEQRRGRAGRTGPGHCVRLWAESEQSTRPAHGEAEILRADLLPLALELASWGVDDAGSLFWLDPPPATGWQAAREQLRTLDAVDADGRLSAAGRAMAATGLHPRLAHMLVRAGSQAATACWLAALLQDERALRGDPGQRTLDLAARLDQLARPGSDLGRAAGQLARRLQIRLDRPEPDRVGGLLALAFPDRLARLRPGERSRYRLRGGGGAMLAADDVLGGSPWLAVFELQSAGADALIRSAAPLSEEQLRADFAEHIETRDCVEWDESAGLVRASRRECLGPLVLSQTALAQPDPEQLRNCLIEGIRSRGLDCLRWTPELRQWLARVRRLGEAGLGPSPPPDFSPATLLEQLPDWLGPALDGLSRIDQVQRLDLGALLRQRLDWNQQRLVEEYLPESIQVPSGSRIRIDYDCEGPPVLAVRLQEMFGLTETPSLGGGRIPLLLHLLSPARRPVQVTADLASFWANGYDAVRRELRGRYPKHAWPEDPARAPALRGAKPRPRR